VSTVWDRNEATGAGVLSNDITPVEHSGDQQTEISFGGRDFRWRDLTPWLLIPAVVVAAFLMIAHLPSRHRPISPPQPTRSPELTLQASNDSFNFGATTATHSVYLAFELEPVPFTMESVSASVHQQPDSQEIAAVVLAPGNLLRVGSARRDALEPVTAIQQGQRPVILIQQQVKCGTNELTFIASRHLSASITFGPGKQRKEVTIADPPTVAEGDAVQAARQACT
jgi:hypothetical protein